MMKFKKGDTLEVMTNKEVPVSWRAAEILSGSSRTYNVKYDFHPVIGNERTVEIVSRKFVRPRPPLIQGVESYTPGDIVEVFEECSWKIAAILKIIGGKVENKRIKSRLQSAAFEKKYVVRLLGSSEELIINRSNIRMRQTWHDDKRIIMGKFQGSQAGDDLIATKPSTSNCCEKVNFEVPHFSKRAKTQLRKVCPKIQDEAAFWESPVLKRMSPYGSSIVEAHNGHAPKKLRAVQDEGWKQRVVLEKVDAVAYPEEISGEKNMHTSFNTLSNGYKEEIQNDVNLGYSDSDACSVGSCSVTSENPRNFCSRFMPMHYEEADTLCSDAESSHVSGSERKSLSFHPKEDLEGNSCWRHASFASNGLKMMPGSAAFLLALNFAFKQMLQFVAAPWYHPSCLSSFSFSSTDLVGCIYVESFFLTNTCVFCQDCRAVQTYSASSC